MQTGFAPGVFHDGRNVPPAGDALAGRAPCLPAIPFHRLPDAHALLKDELQVGDREIVATLDGDHVQA